MRDPTRDDMLDIIVHTARMFECSDFDIEEAIYWFANDWHDGQGSNLYSALSTSEFKPGPRARGCGESAQLLYDELADAFK